MIARNLHNTIAEYMDNFPIIALLGPRQCGKSTLAREFIKDSDHWVYLDLESQKDLKKLEDVEFFFNSIKDKSVCIDEVQLRPDMFGVLRSIIDEDRRAGRIFLLGSASPELLKQGSETLAGRISFLELTPFSLYEIESEFTFREHWLKGGFPPSLLNSSDKFSSIWREDFIRTFIERDLLTLGIRISSNQINRFFTMCAHFQGQLFNISKIGESLGLNRATVTSLLDIFEKTFLMRKLEPYEANVKKRLVKTPKMYVRDSGLLHTLLEIETFQDLLGNPIIGNSWEGYCIENILTKMERWKSYFYRTSHGAEMDLVLIRGVKKIAIEFKSSLAPTLGKGFWNAVEDIQPDKTFVIIPEGEKYQKRDDVWVISLSEFLSGEALF